MKTNKRRTQFKCEECYDTGCSCGGIGMSCHGCCSCEAGKRARERRTKALGDVILFEIPYWVRLRKMNREGFYWMPDGLFTLTWEPIVPETEKAKCVV